MRVGEINRLVSVQSRQQTHDSTYGAQALAWLELKKVYAHIEGIYARDLILMKGSASEVSHKITVRYDADLWADPRVAAQYRIVYGSRIFDLQGVTIVDERNASVELLALEATAAGDDLVPAIEDGDLGPLLWE